MGNAKWFGLGVMCIGLILPQRSVGATIPVSFTADSKILKKTAVAGTMITFELHEDAACSSAIDSEVVDIDDVAVIEAVKLVKINGGTKRAKIARLNFVFSGVSPTAGADLYVKVTGTGITPLDGACQAQEPAGGSAAASGAYAHVYNLSAQVVAIEAPIVFDSNGLLSGFTHTPGTSAITVVTPGIYHVSWIVSGTEPNQFALFVNGVPVPATVFGSGAGTQQNSGQAILNLVAADVVDLRNHSSAAAVGLFPLVGGTKFNVNASITFWQR